MEGDSKTRGIVQLTTDLRSLKYEDASPYTAPLHTRDINGSFAEKTAIQPRKVKGDFLQQYRQYFKNEMTLEGAGVAAQGHARVDDLIRVAKFLGTPKGLLWEMHQAALQSTQYSLNEKRGVPQGFSMYSQNSSGVSDESTKVWDVIKGKVKSVVANAADTIVNNISLTAGTLAQTALNGTGYHHDTFISRAYLVKGSGGGVGNAILNTLGFAGTNKVNGAAAVVGGSREIKGRASYSLIYDKSALLKESRSAVEEVGQIDAEGPDRLKYTNPPRPSVSAPSSSETYVGRHVNTPRYGGKIEDRAAFRELSRDTDSNSYESDFYKRTRRSGSSSELYRIFSESKDPTEGLDCSKFLRMNGDPLDLFSDEKFTRYNDAGEYSVVQEINGWVGGDGNHYSTGTSEGKNTLGTLVSTGSVVDDSREQITAFVGKTEEDLKSGSYTYLVDKDVDLEGKSHGTFGNSRFGILADLLNQSESLGTIGGESLTVQSTRHDFLDKLGSDKDQPSGYSPKKYTFTKQPHSAQAVSGEPQRIATTTGKVSDVGTATHTYQGYSYLNELDGKAEDRAWVRKRLDSGADTDARVAGWGSEAKDQSKIPVEGTLNFKVKDDLSDYLSLIPFCLTTITPDNRTYLNFEANLDSFDDSYTGNWSGTQYIGRAEQFYTYTGFDRKINFAFKVVARKADDLKPLYQKLNILCTSTAPTYDSGKYFMRGTLGSITVGDLVSNQVGFFNSVKVSWKTDYPWEIGNVHSSWEGQVGIEIIRVPHLLDVSVGFTPIHNFNVEMANISDRDRVYFGKKN